MFFEVLRPIYHSPIEDRGDARMLECGERLPFGLESCDLLARAEDRPRNLDCDQTTNWFGLRAR